MVLAVVSTAEPAVAAVLAAALTVEPAVAVTAAPADEPVPSGMQAPVTEVSASSEPPKRSQLVSAQRWSASSDLE